MTAVGKCLVLVSLLSYGGCGTIDPCENKVLARVPSPDGEREAIVFLRDCGATTASSTQVSIVPKGAAFLTSPTDWSSTQKGNAFIVSGGDWMSPATVEVEWAGKGRLMIKHEPREKTFLTAASVLGVSIAYGERSPK